MENLILSLVAPIGLTLFRAGQSQSKNLVKSLTKPFFHLSIGEYQISFLNCTVSKPEMIWYRNNVEVTVRFYIFTLIYYLIDSEWKSI